MYARMNGQCGVTVRPRARTSSSASRASCDPKPFPSCVGSTTVWKKMTRPGASRYSEKPISWSPRNASYLCSAGLSATRSSSVVTRSDYSDSYDDRSSVARDTTADQAPGGRGPAVHPRLRLVRQEEQDPTERNGRAALRQLRHGASVARHGVGRDVRRRSRSEHGD